MSEARRVELRLEFLNIDVPDDLGWDTIVVVSCTSVTVVETCPPVVIRKTWPGKIKSGFFMPFSWAIWGYFEAFPRYRRAIAESVSPRFTT